MNNILSVQPGEYVKGSVIADVSNAKAIQTKTGKTIFKATLRDGQQLVEATSFSKTFEHIDGKRVQFSGPGIRRGDDYNGKVGVTFGEKVVFKAVGEPTPTETAPEAPEPRKSEGKAVSMPSRIEGVTVGMAINKAVDVLNAQQLAVTELAVWQIASRLIRVATRLQAGELHASEEPTSEEVPF
jgi:ribosomal protein L4